MKDCNEDFILASTVLAFELCKDKSLDEIFTIKNMLNQVICTIQTIINEKITNKKQ